jgi:hypothetical protein
MTLGKSVTQHKTTQHFETQHNGLTEHEDV